ncbi:MAG: class I tRNA ligase family protein, partial [Chitinispirillaceae bacterium]|nr:class I tRNA ligase family protein [Chitinispirillaceae bacterium]
EWMENIRDWCISRQIWWGHRLPVWYCGCGETVVEETPPKKCPKCGSAELRQDGDVLDTWFSSWLWPFSTMGWPEETGLYKKFYPTDTLVTAPEILFFWVARMIMAGLHFTGELPFTDVLLHGTVRDKTGRKMSKSLGNALDPMDIIPVYGADALRFSMIMITAQGADVFLSKDTFDLGRNFANKLWNASRFFLSNIETKISFAGLPPADRRKAEDRWILSRLQNVTSSVTAAINGYRFNEAAHTLYDFTWHEFCDWYVEAKKGDLYQENDPQRKTDALAFIGHVHASLLKLLHPFVPFITEEIWSHLREKVSYQSIIDSETVMTASYPKADAALSDPVIEQRFSLLMEIIIALRTIRSENNVPPDRTGKAVIIPESDKDTSWLGTQSALINQFARLSETVIDRAAKKPSFAGTAVVKGMHVYLLLEGLIDRNIETERLNKEIKRVSSLIDGAKNRLENPSFVLRAPEAVIKKEREKLEGLLLNKEKLEKSLSSLKQK